MKNIYFKSLIRDIRSSFGRFVAIILIILMGVLLFVGIKSVGPDLTRTAAQHLETSHASDFQITATTGFTAKDRQAILKKMPHAQVSLGNRVPMVEHRKQKNLQVISFDKNDSQDHLQLAAGHFPGNNHEAVIDAQLRKLYPMGTKLRFTSKQLKQTTVKVVGYVTSPTYIDRKERGITTIGNGQLDGFVYTPKTNFNIPADSTMYIRLKQLRKYEPFSDQYQSKSATAAEKLMQILNARQPIRQRELQQTALVQAKARLAAQGQPVPNTAAIDQQLLQQIKLPKTEYILNQRSDSPGFSDYRSLAERIDAIANVFPGFFFLIAILITFTTMTRMIEENRKEIGTLKALGYFNHEIAIKYLLYALITATIGTTLGILIGSKALPTVVFSILKQQYIFTDYKVAYYGGPILLATGAAIFATVFSALYVLVKDLREKPSTLLLPKAPKAGKRVLLERVTPIWSRLSFNHKITYRNIFRYKARDILTILGIAGCTGLMVAGFGLRDSIGAPADIQFSQLTKYQASVTLKSGQDAVKLNSVSQLLTDASTVQSTLPVHSEQVTLKQKGTTKQTATLMAADQAAKFDAYVTLRTPQQHKLRLTNAGAIISQQLAKTLAVQTGDTITLRTTAGQRYRLKVAGITENYLGHNIYVMHAYLTKQTAKAVPLNTYLLKTKVMTPKQEHRLTQQLLDSGQVLNVNFLSKQIKLQRTTTKSIAPVVLIFIVLSGTLAFVVLYNLMNINISERERELATIKVLGFFNNEVTMYVVRESIIFTGIGILLGFGIGHLLLQFILAQASSELILFPTVIHWSGYVISAVMTIIFSLIVAIVTHFKLKHIHMIQALNASE
ncbi:ABC transporter permease [Lactobacillus sp. CC-MHH1034]|uniref:ABC transporter permease n=1 Tax=Agrilactobacillus fermenti TaxID=2586909 RepID=UPI001E635091|nr:ABC transporter permease [Agrilactobacillus fermenti]MCD2256510.1 ABC transporter permease [Agrilactobacillus fermenti]